MATTIAPKGNKAGRVPAFFDGAGKKPHAAAGLMEWDFTGVLQIDSGPICA
jgi:hypothetical protein